MTEKKRILLIGGTGIIGCAVALEAWAANHEVTVVSINKTRSIPHQVKQVIVDRRDSASFQKTLDGLNSDWDMVFDIYSFNAHDAEQTYQTLKNRAKHVVVLSTTLVYDRSTSPTEPIPHTHPLSTKGVLGGYVDHKLELELFWHSITDLPWTIFRPYHVLGHGSLLGCLPFHNRDPHLLEKVRAGTPLELCEGGNIAINVIHPRDIAMLALKSANNINAHFKCYNAVNPEPVLTKHYYEMIGYLLGHEVKITDIPMESVWEKGLGWELTTLPHLYHTGSLMEDVGFVPNTHVATCIRDAISWHPSYSTLTEDIPVHQRMTMQPRPLPPSWLLKHGT